jgi:Dyp-type peroxidase family
MMASAKPRMAATADGGGLQSPEPLLEIHEIQGNILGGFNKDHKLLLALTIRDVGAAKRWLRRIAPEISTTAEVLQFNTLFRALRAKHGHDPNGLAATWVNIAFTRDGLAALTSPPETDALSDPAFQVGLNKDRAAMLGDPVAAGETDPTKDWVVGGTNRPVHILLIVASDDPKFLATKAKRLSPGRDDGKRAPKLVWKELGQTRPDLPGHEHFGFKDGMSQPGVRGLTSRMPDVFLTPRLLEASAAGNVDFASPGQALVWPGQFVMGYPSCNPSTGDPVQPPELTPKWIKNGSFLVFRRLGQDVAGFHAFVRQQSAILATKPGLSGMTPQRLGALLVGRWASGAPVSRSPTTDLPALAEDKLSNNDFLFANDTPPPVFRVPASPGAFPTAKEDAAGNVCPHAAHIRKMNSRDQDTDLGDAFDTLTRRVLRRGIPYGKPLVKSARGDKIDRGLHFLCYQTAIQEQFEKLQQDWANNKLAPRPGGQDLIIGQNPNLPPNNGHTFEISGESATQTLTAPRQFVVPTGGGYFFAPSISAIRDVLARAG